MPERPVGLGLEGGRAARRAANCADQRLPSLARRRGRSTRSRQPGAAGEAGAQYRLTLLASTSPRISCFSLNKRRSIGANGPISSSRRLPMYLPMKSAVSTLAL